SSSIGIALYPDHGEDLLQLSKSADSAMYGAKRHGRNNVQLFHQEEGLRSA
ncbi:MAG: diguanylate cyclase, partial [Betaproteobacteria bacterium]|nr:diguanylate cyclase [Betaproteobacteria bacterium]